MEYYIYASLREDINSGWVWLEKPNLESRSVIKIKNLKNSKQIYCEALIIDDNFKKHYER